jgi:V/A-type H+-transporting ATPase subunit E
MAGAEKLKEKILNEARLAADKNRREAEKEARGIAQKAEDEAQKASRAILDQAGKDADSRAKRAVAVAELEGRKDVLATKQRLIEELFETAVRDLRALPDAEYEKTLAGMLCQAAEGGEEVILSRDEARKVSAGFIDKVNAERKAQGKPAGLTLSAERRDIPGGFVLKRGDVEVNDSFASIVKTQKDDLEALAVKMLFA